MFVIAYLNEIIRIFMEVINQTLNIVAKPRWSKIAVGNFVVFLSEDAHRSSSYHLAGIRNQI
jgi:hypothetical protein